jgi:hypothetical protein
MATLGPAGKMRRVLEFLIGLRDDRVVAALATRGFGKPERELGWDLVRTLGLTQTVPLVTTKGDAQEAALDAWQREWFRVARASLEQAYPKAYEQLFSGLNQRRKSSVSLVLEFLSRLDALARAKDAANCAAIEKLRARGLTSAQVKKARHLIDELRRPAPPLLVDVEQRRAEIRRAEAALWSYYREWSQIALAVIKDARLRKLLGYLGEQSPDNDTHAPLVTAVPSVAAEVVGDDRMQARSAGPRRQRKRVTRVRRKSDAT